MAERALTPEDRQPMTATLITTVALAVLLTIAPAHVRLR